MNHERHSLDRLRFLCTIMRCPETREDLELTNDGHLRAKISGRLWETSGGIANFLPGVRLPSQTYAHVSNAIAPEAQRIIDNSHGLVLNVSAGGTVDPPPHVIEVEFDYFLNTDIIGDVHNLPLKDRTFDAIICLNAFEHYHSPLTASDELYRILKTDGIILVHTAFLQPVHEAPNHFFGCTEFGLAKWFEKFEEVEISVTPNFNPLYTLSWLASDLCLALRATAPALADQIGAMTLREVAEFWQGPERDPVMASVFAEIPDEIQRRLAAGYQYIGRRRG